MASNTGPVIAATAAGFSALATGAAWLSIRRQARMWRLGQRPNLDFMLYLQREDGAMELAIQNSGPGVARRVSFKVVRLGEQIRQDFDRFPPITIAPLETARFYTGFPPVERADVFGVVACYDSSDMLHMWHGVGDYYKPDWPKSRRGAIDRLFGLAYPELESTGFAAVSCSRPTPDVMKPRSHRPRAIATVLEDVVQGLRKLERPDE